MTPVSRHRRCGDDLLASENRDTNIAAVALIPWRVQISLSGFSPANSESSPLLIPEIVGNIPLAARCAPPHSCNNGIVSSKQSLVLPQNIE